MMLHGCITLNPKPGKSNDYKRVDYLLVVKFLAALELITVLWFSSV